MAIGGGIGIQQTEGDSNSHGKQPPTQLWCDGGRELCSPPVQGSGPSRRPISTLETRRMMNDVMQIPAARTPIRHGARYMTRESLIVAAARPPDLLVVGNSTQEDLTGSTRGLRCKQNHRQDWNGRKRQWCGLLARRDKKVTRPAEHPSRLSRSPNRPRRQMDRPTGLNGGRGREGRPGWWVKGGAA